MTSDERADAAVKDWENEGGSASPEPRPDRERTFAHAFRWRMHHNALGAERAEGPSCPFPRASAAS
jgi:hypothetical protein